MKVSTSFGGLKKNKVVPASTSIFGMPLIAPLVSAAS